MSRARSWCFTYNNPDKEYDYKKIACRYMIVGDEKGELKNTPHHQGYVMFPLKKSLKKLKKIMPEGCHLEIAKGSPQQNIAYCSKEKIYYEFGERPKMGKRNDILTVKEIVKNKGGMKDIIESVNSYQAMRCGELILKYHEQPRTEKPTVKWYWGKTGTGKTRSAYAECKDPWMSGKNLKWWEGYDAHKHVIIDDFRKDFCTFHELLRLLDRYPYRIENKGGSRQFLATLIIITSPDSPINTYDTREDVNQLIRRIDEIKEFTE